MEEQEVVYLEIDTGQAEQAIAQITKELDGLGRIAEKIGASFAKVFAPLEETIDRAEEGMGSLTAAVKRSTKAVKSLMASMADQQAESNMLSAAGTAATVASTIVAAITAVTTAEQLQIAMKIAWNAICGVATAVTTAFGAAMQFLTSPIGLVILGITALIAIIVLLVQNWDTVKAVAEQVWTAIQEKLTAFDAFLQGVFAKDWTEQFGAFGNILNSFFANVQNIWESIKSVFSGIVTFIQGVFSGDWEKAWTGIVDIFSGIWEGILAAVKIPINGVIGLINGLMNGVVAGINMVISALNTLKIDIPDWVPGLGGQTFGFAIPALKAPKIPYLAQGAVLPANKPFLAVVGDQKHGTNVEAPLATIQEAVAVVMQDQTSAILSGFQASIGVQREILEAVLGIQIGDAVIAQAAQRYQRKMAVVHGV